MRGSCSRAPSRKFWAVPLAQVVWGIGYTFTSGATEAWITDEVGEEHVQPLFTRATQLGLAMQFAGTLLAGLVGSLGLGRPLVVAGAGYVATAAVLALVMPERHFHRTPPGERESYGRLGRLLGDALAQARRRRVVRSFLVVSVVLGLSSEAVDRLWVPRVVADFTLPDVPGLSALGGSSELAGAFTLFALVSAALSLVVSLVVNRYAERAVRNPHPSWLLAGLVVVEVAGVVGLALLGNLWLAVAAMWTRNAVRALAIPIRAAWLNRNVDSRSRATLISVESQLDAVGQVAGGPPSARSRPGRRSPWRCSSPPPCSPRPPRSTPGCARTRTSSPPESYKSPCRAWLARLRVRERHGHDLEARREAR